MGKAKTKQQLWEEAERAAQKYLASLRLEHFMESTPQAQQRKITLESLDLVAARRSDLHVYNELLVQYRFNGGHRLEQVVPDNMVVLHDGPIEAKGSYNHHLLKIDPLWVMEYVSKSNMRKDYETNYTRYEKELKVPYYLTFYPDEQEMSLFHRKRGKYASVKPNEHGRLPLPELDLELAVLDDWVRFWFKGELLPLPAEMQRDLEEWRKRATNAEHRATNAEHRATNAEHRATTAEEKASALAARMQRLEAQLRQHGLDPTNGE